MVYIWNSQELPLAFAICTCSSKGLLDQRERGQQDLIIPPDLKACLLYTTTGVVVPCTVKGIWSAQE